MKPHQDTDQLDVLLASWQVEGEVPVRFQREVWNRISSRDGALAWWEELSIRFLKPWNLGFAALAAVIIGSLWAVVQTQPSAQTPHDAYVQSVSPFVSVHLASH